LRNIYEKNYFLWYDFIHFSIHSWTSTYSLLECFRGRLFSLKPYSLIYTDHIIIDVLDCIDIEQKIHLYKNIVQLCYHATMLCFKVLILFVSVTIIILFSKVALVLNESITVAFYPSTYQTCRELTYEPRNCAHSCQTFKLFLTASPAHKIITTLTWALEFPSGRHFQHFHRHAHFLFY